jgi:hypothetical protein
MAALHSTIVNHNTPQQKQTSRRGTELGGHTGCRVVFGEACISTWHVSLLSDNVLWPFHDLEQYIWTHKRTFEEQHQEKG